MFSNFNIRTFIENSSDSEDDLSYEIDNTSYTYTMDYNEYHMSRSLLYCRHMFEKDDDYDVYDVYDELEKY